MPDVVSRGTYITLEYKEADRGNVSGMFMGITEQSGKYLLRIEADDGRKAEFDVGLFRNARIIGRQLRIG